jgi:hypothetical protein
VLYALKPSAKPAEKPPPDGIPHESMSLNYTVVSGMIENKQPAGVKIKLKLTSSL